MKTTLFHSILGMIFLFILNSGCNNVDTSKKSDKNSAEKTIDLRNEEAEKLVRDEPKQAEELARQAMKLSQTKDYPLGEARAREILGQAFYNQSDYANALVYFNQNLEIYKEMADTASWMGVLVDIGMVFDNQGKYEGATKNYFEALNFYGEKNKKAEIAKVHNLLGLIFIKQDNYQEAMDHFRQDSIILRELLIKEPKNFYYKRNLIVVIGNIGLVFDKKQSYREALVYYLQAQKIAEEIKSQKDVALLSNNIGFVYKALGDYVKAIEYLEKGLEINQRIGNKEREAYNLLNLGAVYADKKDYQQSFEKLEEAKKKAEEIGDKNLLVEIYANLYDIYSASENYSKANEYCGLYAGLKSELLGEESSKQIAESTIKHNVAMFQKENEVQNEKIKRQNIFLFSLAGIILLVIVALIVGIRFYRLLVKRKIEIEKQKGKIEEHQKETMDSINYAKRIQQAILPKNEEIAAALPESFLLFIPKDIVSGDFFWMSRKENQILIAAADCTGHGVPGALMSMVNTSLLNEAVNAKGLIQPNEILDEVRRGVIRSLKQRGESGEQQDGMDIALVSLNGHTLQYAGANNSMYVIRRSDNPVIEEIDPDPMPIGIGERKDDFTNNVVQLQKGDTFYIFTDGYADQFGGPKGKKFKYSQFKQLLLSIQGKTMNEQSEILEARIKEWKGVLEQVDDILVIGVRV